MVERRREEARWKDLKSQPGALLIVKAPDGTAQLVRAKGVIITGDVFAAELPGGGKGVWKKDLVAEQLPWPKPGELDSSGNLESALQLLARYEAAAANYPALKAELTADRARSRHS